MNCQEPKVLYFGVFGLQVCSLGLWLHGDSRLRVCSPTLHPGMGSTVRHLDRSLTPTPACLMRGRLAFRHILHFECFGRYMLRGCYFPFELPVSQTSHACYGMWFENASVGVRVSNFNRRPGVGSMEEVVLRPILGERDRLREGGGKRQQG